MKGQQVCAILSSAFDIIPEGSCKRWSKADKNNIPINQTASVNSYNTFMGGVDLMDRLISYYRLYTHTKKWTVRVFVHFLDIAVCNGWIQYDRHYKVSATPKTDRLQMIDYKLRIAESLIKKELME